jgi:hypothetical protein
VKELSIYYAVHAKQTIVNFANIIFFVQIHMESVTVESYAGSQAEEHPLRFYIDKRKIEIISIEKRWLTPGCRCFKVLGDNGCLYVLEYNSHKDTWSLLKVDRP